MAPTPIHADTAQRRTARQNASRDRREAFWAARLAVADTPRKRMQVWYDRLRAVVRGAMPQGLADELWQEIIDDLQQLCLRLEDRVEQHQIERRERQQVLPARPKRLGFW
ncbi:hypothetical protein GCM10009827_083910 [Dactylosporangium maewongense]|uniref:Uncharacterized protein n=1 Tax=Dactylosporangium maewongense TaxID=634393 RepID=A0ABN2C062_9ACTN